MKKKLPDLINQIKKAIDSGLPGKTAQNKMSPAFRNPINYNLKSAQNVREGAVLILLYPENDSTKTVLIERPEYIGYHSGQISFPGGKKEEADETLYATALREAEEEVGLTKNRVNFIGGITELYIPVSNFMVYPFIAYVDEKPLFLPDKREVKSLIEMDLSLLDNSEIIVRKKIKLANGLLMDTPCYNINDKTVWGATAMIISEFKNIISEAN